MSDASHVTAERARALQIRLSEIRTATAAAEEAMDLFRGASDTIRAHWLALELGGYAEHVDVQGLHEVLGVPSVDRLVAHVAGYRMQRGIDVTLDHRAREFRHFFVESLAALETVRAEIAASAGGPTVQLDFGPHPLDPQYPSRAEFTRSVFDRVVAGFLAALHLQLGTLTA